jgi:4'-phosphopantetheinyl transferase
MTQSTPALTVQEQVICLWVANLDEIARHIDFSCVLSEAEQDRSNHIQGETHRKRFIAARGVLRKLLGCYLRINPVEVPFDYGPSGKPQLVLPERGINLRFNLSHSQHLAVVAVASGSEVGVDVEFLRHDWSKEYILKLAKRYFHPREAEHLRTIPDEERVTMFFRLWTRKEALSKAQGKGLWKTISEDVSDQRTFCEWSIHELQLAPEFAGTVAVTGSNYKLRQFDFALLDVVEHFAN